MGNEYPKDIKWTRQRKAVYEILSSAVNPLNATQIYDLLSKEGEEKFALSTVYRILATFEEHHLVTKEALMGEEIFSYSLDRGEHTHYAICLDCHKRIPLEHCPFAHVDLKGETKDFVITAHKLELYGYCRSCKERHLEK